GLGGRKTGVNQTLAGVSDRRRDREVVFDWVSDGVLLALEVHEVKELVLLNRAADGPAELLETEGRLGQGRRVEVVARVEGGIAEITVNRPVNGVGAGLHAHVDDPARLPPEFGSRIGLSLKFIDG